MYELHYAEMHVEHVKHGESPRTLLFRTTVYNRVESTASMNSGLVPRRLDFLKKLSRIQKVHVRDYWQLSSARKEQPRCRHFRVMINLCAFCRIIED